VFEDSEKRGQIGHGSPDRSGVRPPSPGRKMLPMRGAQFNGKGQFLRRLRNHS
jgi:hypothetical protein